MTSGGLVGRGPSQEIQASAFDGRPSVRDRLKHELAVLDKRRVEVEEALALLDRNPDTERLMDLIRG